MFSDGFPHVPSDESKSFEAWFQDLQLSVNECFENPESREEVETSQRRLAVSYWLDGRMDGLVFCFHFNIVPQL